MAGIIPLVYLTNINVRSSGQISLLPFHSSPLSLLYTLQFDIGKRLFCPSEPYSANTSICLFCEKKSVAKAKVFFLLIQSAFFPRPRHPPLLHRLSSLLKFLFERIRGFRFSMAAGSQSVESWAKKLDPVQLGKKIHFSLEIARCSTRARLPKECRNFRNFPYIFSIHMFSFILHFSKPPESEVACTWAESLICK